MPYSGASQGASPVPRPLFGVAAHPPPTSVGVTVVQLRYYSDENLPHSLPGGVAEAWDNVDTRQPYLVGVWQLNVTTSP